MAEVELPSSGVLGATVQAGEGCRAGRSRPVTAQPAGHLEPTANPAQNAGHQPPLVVITGPLTCVGESVPQSERSSRSKAHAWPGTRGPELGDGPGPRPAAPAQWTPRTSPGEGIQWVLGGGVRRGCISEHFHRQGSRQVEGAGARKSSSESW